MGKHNDFERRYNIFDHSQIICLSPDRVIWSIIFRIIDFFDVPNTVDTSEVNAATSATLVRAQRQMRAGLEYSVATRKVR